MASALIQSVCAHGHELNPRFHRDVNIPNPILNVICFDSLETGSGSGRCNVGDIYFNTKARHTV